VTQAFCGSCNRARLSTEGQLYTCLFASQGYDLRGVLRDGSVDDSSGNDAQLVSTIGQIWRGRSDRYSELRSAKAPDTSTTTVAARRVEMSYIGG
jgi:GTP 3',8-cyclase